MREKIRNKILEAKEKAIEAKNDPRIIALVLVEIIFSFAIAFSIYFYFDPEKNIKDLPDIPFPLNLISFAVLMAIFIYLFSLTKQFRLERKAKTERK